jgi:hypothetical protein
VSEPTDQVAELSEEEFRRRIAWAMASIHDEYRQLLKETLPATTVDRLLFTWRRLSEEERIEFATGNAAPTQGSVAMASFFMIEGTIISTAAIRSIERDGNTIEIEFRDGTRRSIKLTKTPEHELAVLGNLTGEVIPAAAGWRVAEYFGANEDSPEQILYRGVVAFRVGPRSIVEPITYWPCMDGYCALVDPQGVFADLSDEGDGFTDEAGFLAAQRERWKDTPETGPTLHIVN